MSQSREQREIERLRRKLNDISRELRRLQRNVAQQEAVGSSNPGGTQSVNTADHDDLSGVTKNNHHNEDHQARHQGGGADELLHDNTGSVGKNNHHNEDHQARHQGGGADALSHDALADFVAAEHVSLPNLTSKVITQADEDLDMNNHQVSNLGTPVQNNDATHKLYVDGSFTEFSFQEPVLDFRDLVNNEPTSPTTGDRYINTTTGTTSTTGESVTEDYIYEWDGSSWLNIETQPLVGMNCFVQATAYERDFLYNGSDWVARNPFGYNAEDFADLNAGTYQNGESIGTPDSGDQFIQTQNAGSYTKDYVYEWNGSSYDEKIPKNGDKARIKRQGEYYEYFGSAIGWIKETPVQRVEDLFDLSIVSGVTLSKLAQEIDQASDSGNSVSISTQDTSPVGSYMRPDGRRLYVYGVQNNKVYQYNLSTPYDLSSASYSTQLAITPTVTAGGDILFNPEGNRMYLLISGTEDEIYEYDLTTEWDLSTASKTGETLDTTTEDTDPQSITFNPQGTRLYVLGNTGDKIYEYRLNANWDLGSAFYTGRTFDVSSETSNPVSIFVSYTGSRMYLMGFDADTVNDYYIYEYYFVSPWNISTLTYLSASYDLPAANADGNFGQIDFSPYGDRFYQLSEYKQRVYQYDLLYDLSRFNTHYYTQSDWETDFGLTEAQLLDLLMKNQADWVPCIFEVYHASGRPYGVETAYTNVDTNDSLWMFRCPLPAQLGSLDLNVSGVRIAISDADADDYVDRVRIFGEDDTGFTTIEDETANITISTTETYQYSGNDVSAYNGVVVCVNTSVTTANHLDIQAVELRCHYG